MMSMRRMACFRIAVVGFMSVASLACSGPAPVREAAVSNEAAPLVINPTKSLDFSRLDIPAFPDSISKNLVMGHEARDEQVIAVALRRNKDVQVKNVAFQTSDFTVVTRARYGQATPTNDLGKPEAYFRAQENAGRGVAVVALRMSEQVDAMPAGISTLLLHFDGATWYATLNSFGGTRINITRYTYKKHGVLEALTQTDSFPETTRFDWSDDAMPRLLVGVPCGTGWCMIGTTNSVMNADDPLDSSSTVVPASHRVRGWYDRKFDPTTNKWAFIFPDPGIGDLQKNQFKKNVVPLASIVVDAANKDIRFAAEWEGKADDDFRAYTSGRNAEMYKWQDHTDKLPGAARWGSGIYVSQEIGPHPIVTNATGLQVNVADLIDLGDMWVRCASGCCQATFQ